VDVTNETKAVADPITELHREMVEATLGAYTRAMADLDRLPTNSGPLAPMALRLDEDPTAFIKRCRAAAKARRQLASSYGVKVMNDYAESEATS
jgi:hypothetical protein